MTLGEDGTPIGHVKASVGRARDDGRAVEEPPAAVAREEEDAAAAPPAAAAAQPGASAEDPPERGALSAEEVAALARTIEALLFLAPEPVASGDLCEAAECDAIDLTEALALLRAAYAPGQRGIELRELAGGFTLATAADTEPAARRLLARPRTPPLTPAQAETLAIVAYLQPVSRPEITRIRGVSADSAAATLVERGLVEEGGRSQFGAVLYRTTPLFLKLFGIGSLEDLPDPARWDPTPGEEAELRDRLLRAGEARAGVQTPPPDPAASATD